MANGGESGRSGAGMGAGSLLGAFWRSNFEEEDTGKASATPVGTQPSKLSCRVTANEAADNKLCKK